MWMACLRGLMGRLLALALDNCYFKVMMWNFLLNWHPMNNQLQKIELKQNTQMHLLQFIGKFWLELDQNNLEFPRKCMFWRLDRKWENQLWLEKSTSRQVRKCQLCLYKPSCRLLDNHCQLWTKAESKLADHLSELKSHSLMALLHVCSQTDTCRWQSPCGSLFLILKQLKTRGCTGCLLQRSREWWSGIPEQK